MAELEKYAKLLGVSIDVDLSDLKKRYAELQARIELQLRSDDPEAVKKGCRNMQLLEQAYQAMAAVAGRNSVQSRPGEEAPPIKPGAMSVELDTHRVGFNLNESEDFQVVVNRRINHFKINWPYGKVIFYNNKLKLKALMFAAEIQYHHIDSLSRLFFLPFTFRIRHQEAGVHPMVILYGLGLGGKIKRLNEEHNLGLNIEY